MIKLSDKTKVWAKATAIRCVRQFFFTMAGFVPAGTLVTDLDWKVIFLSCFSSSVVAFIACVVAGLPEIDVETEDMPDIYEVSEEEEIE